MTNYWHRTSRERQRTVLGAAARATRRPASVLVLVMTLLAILFVIGVAFLATMNFEADMIEAEKQMARSQAGTDAVAEELGQILREEFMVNDEEPFGSASAGASVTSFSPLPGWHNTSSPLEPIETTQINPATGNEERAFVLPWMTDPQGTAQTPFAGTVWLGASILTSWADGTTWTDGEGQLVRALTRTCVGGVNNGNPCLNDAGCPLDLSGMPATCSGGVCAGGSNDGVSCDPAIPATCPGLTALGDPATCSLATVEFGYTCVGGVNDGLPCYRPLNCTTNCDVNCPDGTCGDPDPAATVAGRIIPADADGDGVVDSILVNAKTFGFSESQIAELSTTVNPPTKKNGEVYVALRIVPHGGMVNLNDAHPKLIETLLRVPDLKTPRDPEYGNFYHRPTLEEKFDAYAPAVEESILRRRNFLPSRNLPPSRLHGNALIPKTERKSRPNADGDMAWQLFAYDRKARKFETVYGNEHRFWDFGPRLDARGFYKLEESIPGSPDSDPLWVSRVEPFTSLALSASLSEDDYQEYDKRHLVTTVSHDDLLNRGGAVRTPSGMKDIRRAMIEANQTAPDACAAGDLLPFEYADYPTDLPNLTAPDASLDDVCDCPSKLGCVPDRRKGRLQLSLPWLDFAINTALNPSPITVGQRNRIIYDAFLMLLNNASGPYWDGKCRVGTAGDCLPWEVCNPLGIADQGTCDDLVLRQPHRSAMITRTAASLTANMIDFMDTDDIPTRIALRSFDFTEGATCVGGVRVGMFCPNGTADCLDPNRTVHNDGECQFPSAICVGGGNASMPCPYGDVDCPDGHCVAPSVGREINISGVPGTQTDMYVYGLERQPFITEVATAYDSDGNLQGRAVELFNPSDMPVSLIGYSLVEIDPANPAPATWRYHALDQTLAAGQFTVIRSDVPGGVFGSLPLATTDGTIRPLLPPVGETALSFANGWILYLVRHVDTAYETKPGSGTYVPTTVAVDQFAVTGANIGMPTLPADSLVTLERAASTTIPWTAPVPSAIESPTTSGTHTLGQSNVVLASTTHNVELFFADTGTFTGPKDTTLNPPDYSVAFPTTGSLLLLPRHANRSFSDLTPPPYAATLTFTNLKDLAFTWWLARTDNALAVNATTNAYGLPQAVIPESTQVDNGRMPIFDIGAKGGTPGASPVYYSAHHVPPRQTASGASTIGRPGDAANLPWGQLVFDYFTALPLRNPGPYRSDDLNEKALPEAQPRVDLAGLRVHGRIDLNAAPWMVMKGLPLVPMYKLPTTIRGRVESFLAPQYFDVGANARTPVPIPEAAGILFDERAQGIVAYREAREAVPASVRGTTPATGDYSTPLAGRSWTDPDPAFRRGMGFLTVGELANVRFDDGAGVVPPPNAAYRIDGGFVQRDIGVTTPPYVATAHDYLNAAATLIALGDWVTVRSQVSTVYGVIRGEEDVTILYPDDLEKQDRLRRQDLQARSLRFQETLDRLPTFLGAQRPARIGERVIGKYRDIQND